MKRRSLFAAPLLLLAACRSRRAGPGPGETVRAADYDAVFVWPGVHPSDDLKPRSVYLLDGEIRREGPARLVRLKAGPPRLSAPEVWLVVRADRLDWEEDAYAALFADLEAWREAGDQVVGLQVDFDAATRGIGGYADFLADLRRRLPPDYRLSITGLMDWSAHGDPLALAALKGVVDEVVVQTYQGRATIPGYEAYFRRMRDFPIPFRVALAEGARWRAPALLAGHPMFRGYVVFLIKPRA